MACRKESVIVSNESMKKNIEIGLKAADDGKDIKSQEGSKTEKKDSEHEQSISQQNNWHILSAALPR